MPVVDGLLAATALAHDLTLVTRNTRQVAGTRRSFARSLQGLITAPRRCAARARNRATSPSTGRRRRRRRCRRARRWRRCRTWSAISDGGPPPTGAANRLRDGVEPQLRARLAAVTIRLSPAIAEAFAALLDGQRHQGLDGRAASGQARQRRRPQIGEMREVKRVGRGEQRKRAARHADDAHPRRHRPAPPPARCAGRSCTAVAPMAPNGVQYRTPSRIASDAISSFAAAVTSVIGAVPGGAANGSMRTAPLPSPELSRVHPSSRCSPSSATRSAPRTARVTTSSAVPSARVLCSARSRRAHPEDEAAGQQQVATAPGNTDAASASAARALGYAAARCATPTARSWASSSRCLSYPRRARTRRSAPRTARACRAVAAAATYRATTRRAPAPRWRSAAPSPRRTPPQRRLLPPPTLTAPPRE